MKIIYETSFALDDCRLFLDTHPYDKEALEYYETYRELRQQAVDEYVECYGPLSWYDKEPSDVWTWIDEPWPWEGVC
jgi:spore coat protein JB